MNAFALAALHGSGWSRSASAAKVLRFHDLRAICDSGIAMVSARRGLNASAVLTLLLNTPVPSVISDFLRKEMSASLLD